jgi:hypothetical protein
MRYNLNVITLLQRCYKTVIFDFQLIFFIKAKFMHNEKTYNNKFDESETLVHCARTKVINRQM